MVAAYSNLAYPHKTAEELRKIIDTARKSDRGAGALSPVRNLRRRLGPTGIAEIVASYESGKSLNYLNTRYDISKAGLLRLLSEEGIDTRKRRVVSPEQTDEIIRRYQAGESTYQLEASQHIPHTTIARTLQRAGVTMRRRGRPARL